MSQLTIEIHGTGLHNRGAELMTLAIADRFRAKFDPIRIVVPSAYFRRPEDRNRYGLYTTWEFGFQPRGWKRLVHEYGPAWLRRRARMIAPREVDLVLDASGFAYSDQWGDRAPTWILAKMSQPERLHQPLILLPQAFGPFIKPEAAQLCANVFNRAELSFARDSQSQRAVQALHTRTDLRLCPDFTVDLKPEPDHSLALPHPFFAVVPNVRMLNKTTKWEEYLRFLESAIHKVRTLGWNPVFVLHDSLSDHTVVQQLSTSSRQLPVIYHQNPRVLKWVLGQAHAVLASRFHALIGSLAQGVPSLGAGWSHKYPELFKDFGCSELYLPDVQDLALLDQTLTRLADSGMYQAIRDTLTASKIPISRAVESMWIEVENRIEQVRAKLNTEPGQ